MNYNLLIEGENLKALGYLIENQNLAGKVDLIYIDPPFATGGNFTISEDRVSTISKSYKDDVAYTDTLKGSEYLNFLKERLFLLKELMSDKGSIYLHIDYKIGHYVKVLMDEVFGFDNFRNDITRVKCNPKNFERIGYGNIKDMILFYSKSANPIWNEPKQPYTNEDLQKLFPKQDKSGRRYTTVPIHAPGETKNGKSSELFRDMHPPKGRHWRTDVETLEIWDKEGLIEWSSTGNPRKIIYADEKEGKRIQDIWEYKDPQYPSYPTEKNSEILDLIIKTSSNPNSLVLDCFCGSGTTLKSAHLLNRNWIGIDKSEHALQVCKNKLNSIDADLFIPKVEYQYLNINKAGQKTVNS